MVGQVLPGDWVGIAGTDRSVRQCQLGGRGCLLSKDQGGLDSQVHNHDTLGTQSVGQNLERIGNQESRPRNSVEDREQPNEDDLGITRGLDILSLFIHRGSDCPRKEHEDHARGGNKEERSTPDSVDKECTANTDHQTQQRLTTVQLETLSAFMGKAMRVRDDLGAYRNLLGLLSDTHAVVDQASVVAEQGITTVLRDNSKGD